MPRIFANFGIGTLADVCSGLLGAGVDGSPDQKVGPPPYPPPQAGEGKGGGGVAREPLGADFIIPTLACGLTAYYFVSTIDMVWEAKATGIVIGVVLAAMCVAHVARLGLRIAAGRGSFSLGELISNDLFNRQRLGLLVLVILFIVTIQWVGTTLGLFLLLIYLLGSRLPKGVIEKLVDSITGAG